jgi:MoaA/NifB/PqqE/SkfB family radical SAM enzyme
MTGPFRVLNRLVRHARITWKNLAIPRIPSPPFLILFINSVCNLKCGHCFYRENLNSKDDLTTEEIIKLSDDLGRVENLNISGGEPFLRQDFAMICQRFIRNNGVEQIYAPTNAYYTAQTVQKVKDTLTERRLKLLVVEISLDGMPDYHNRLRGSDHSFQNAMKTYEALVELQLSDKRLRIHAISTATGSNMEEIRNLSEYLFHNRPGIDHHSVALIRGDWANKDIARPDLEEYQSLHERIRKLWAPREQGRFGGIVEPMLQWAKTRTANEGRQVAPCRAGILSAVVYANGDVSVCESLPALGNLRNKSFMDIWRSKEADDVRRSIRDKKCFCTNEVFLWPSITFQPLHLANAMFHAKVWKKP